MINTIITDLSRVLLFPVNDTYQDSLNELHEKLSEKEDYDFWKFFKLNEKILNFYQKLSEKIDLYLFTSGAIQEYSPLKHKLEEVFKDIFSAADLGLQKTDHEAYLKLITMIDVEPRQVLVVDDQPDNIQAAKDGGLATHLYTTNEGLITQVGMLRIMS
jgi:HAD superfamily hydrolase (TIGR01549 family)